MEKEAVGIRRILGTSQFIYLPRLPVYLCPREGGPRMVDVTHDRKCPRTRRKRLEEELWLVDPFIFEQPSNEQSMMVHISDDITSHCYDINNNDTSALLYVHNSPGIVLFVSRSLAQRREPSARIGTVLRMVTLVNGDRQRCGRKGGQNGEKLICKQFHREGMHSILEEVHFVKKYLGEIQKVAVKNAILTSAAVRSIGIAPFLQADEESAVCSDFAWASVAYRAYFLWLVRGLLSTNSYNLFST